MVLYCCLTLICIISENSEFADASNSNVEWQRFSGGQSLQSSRQGEYGASPPTVHSRGGYGRWDTRSSGSNDADGQSDRESGMCCDLFLSLTLGLVRL